MNVGEHIKVLFERESMWVKITAVNNDGTVTGVLDNTPLFTDLHGYVLGDVVTCVLRWLPLKRG